MNNAPNFDEQTNLYIKELMEIILRERFGDLTKDYNACKELLEISEKNDYLYGQAFAYAYLGDYFIGSNDSINASTNLMRAKEICEKNRFEDLLPYVCNWLGLYYEMQRDRQMAMHYYLDALELSEMNDDLLRKSILLNNIASQFQSSGSYEVAKEYYIKAFNCFNELETTHVTDPHYAQMSANIVSVCCHLGQVEEAKYYFYLLKKSGQLAQNKNQLYLCELLISSSLGDVEKTNKNVDMLLAEMRKHPQNLHQLFETVLIVADGMIGLEEEEYAREILTSLNEMCCEDEYGQRLKVQYVWMRFFKSYGTETERNEAYRVFYELRARCDEILNKNLADGLLSKIKLRESVKENMKIEEEKEQLKTEIKFDELTKLYNRRYFRNLTKSISIEKDIKSISLIMIDVDYFKQYNDTYGHAKGDEALKAVGEVMDSDVDENIYNFRYGGDEFVCVCIDKTVEELENHVQTLVKEINSRDIEHKASQCSERITLSIGGSISIRENGNPIDMIQLMSEADTALYEAKDKGRNGYVIYSKDKK